MNYIECTKELPPEGEEVFTKIDDKDGCRNEGSLYRQGNLWFVPDGSMYVYYRPTHWAKKTTEQKRASIQKQMEEPAKKLARLKAELAAL